MITISEVGRRRRALVAPMLFNAINIMDSERLVGEQGRNPQKSPYHLPYSISQIVDQCEWMEKSEI